MRIELAQEETVIRKPPANLRDSDSRLFRHEMEKTFPAVHTKTYRKVTILPNGAIIKHLILSELFFCKSIPQRGVVKVKSFAKLYINTITEIIRTSETVHIDKVLFLTNFYSDNFFHWMGDVLPKLEVLSSSGISLKDYTLVVPKTCDNVYTRYTLNRYNLPFVILESHQRVKAKNLVYTPILAPTGNFRPQLMERIRSRFLNRIPPSGTKSDRVYISRKKAAKRRILNEHELLPLLKNHHFRVVIMEDLTFEEQIKLMANTDTLMSLHGAGLTHMLWMNEGSKVIEIRADNDAKNNLFFSLASDLNLKYSYMFAKPSNTNATTQKTDFLVNPESLDSLLQSVL